ncbi:MAG: ATP-binding protein [Planctomycetota bacterium]|nr:MAG: ATP-binding protein [Planctomycetota bacterium]
MSNQSQVWTYERAIPSDLTLGNQVLEDLLARFEADGWDARQIFGIRLALEEAVVNAIKHGNCLDCNKQVHVICRSTVDKIWIKVSDQGEGFDPEAVPDCTDEEHIDIPSGRGIMLMRNFMSRVEYNDKGNVVEMEKHRDHGS